MWGSLIVTLCASARSAQACAVRAMPRPATNNSPLIGASAYNGRTRFMRNPIHMRAVQLAVEIAGGSRPLAMYLKVSPLLVAAWIEGAHEPPPNAFLKVLEIVLGQESARLRGAIPASEVEVFK